jgi:hypothetical protein
MRQGNYEVIVVGADGEPVEERLINGDAVVVARPGAAFRVKLYIYPTQEGAFPVLRICARLFVDGVLAEKCCVELSGHSRIECTFQGFRKNLTEKVEYVFSDLEPGKDVPSLVNSECGKLKIVVLRAENTGQIVVADTTPTVPSTKEQNEDLKYWMQPSAVTAAGKPVPVPAGPTSILWTAHEILETLTLLYHTDETITFLQQFHEEQRQRELLAESLRANAALRQEQGDAPQIIDLTEGDVKVEINKEKLQEIDLTGVGAGEQAAASAVCEGEQQAASEPPDGERPAATGARRKRPLGVAPNRSKSTRKAGRDDGGNVKSRKVGTRASPTAVASVD